MLVFDEDCLSPYKRDVLPTGSFFTIHSLRMVVAPLKSGLHVVAPKLNESLFSLVNVVPGVEVYVIAWGSLFIFTIILILITVYVIARLVH